MSDITERLRRCCDYETITDQVRSFSSAAPNGLVLDAADEIERLRAILGAIHRVANAKKGGATRNLAKISKLAEGSRIATPAPVE